MRKALSVLMCSALVFMAGLPAAQMAVADIPVSGAASGQVPSLAPILDEAMPAVVNIAARAKVQQVEQGHFPDPFNDPFFNDPFFRHFFGDSPFRGRLAPRQPQPQHPQEAQSIGSGVIVDGGNGYILTNHHVVRNADELFVILKDKRRLPAKIVGWDPETDIAVLKVEGENLGAMKMGDSSQLRVGDYVVAIGSPFGLSHTVTSGIVSALGRSGLGIEGYEDFIQTDAPINPGNSGGALMDLHGNLIGINTAIYSRSGGSMGIGFSIPINMAKAVMAQIIAHGSVERGFIGVSTQDVTPDIAEALDLKDSHAALITNIVPDSPADKAGLRVGDVVTHINGAIVKSSADLRNHIGLLRVGQGAKITLLRDGKQGEAELVIGEVVEEKPVEVQDVNVLQGASFSEIPAEHPAHGKMKGVYIAGVEYGSNAWRFGLREGDVILSVNQKQVENIAQLREAAADKSTLLLNLQRGNASVFIVVR